MGNDLTVANSARCSFDKQSDLDDNGYLRTEDIRLINYLAKHKHWTPFSHATVSFRVTMPIFVARQLAKHQIGGSVNEVSRRYVDSDPVFDIPKKWRKRAENVKQGSSDECIVVDTALKSEIDKFFESAELLYKDLLMMGVCPEQARAVLPLCTETTWVWTGSLYFFARVCNLRLDPHAQRETAEVAMAIDRHMNNLFPISWAALRKRND
jgi:thymidylate synthase (FAD)